MKFFDPNLLGHRDDSKGPQDTEIMAGTLKGLAFHVIGAADVSLVHSVLTKQLLDDALQRMWNCPPQDLAVLVPPPLLLTNEQIDERAVTFREACYCRRCSFLKEPSRKGNSLCGSCHADMWSKAKSYGGSLPEVRERAVSYLREWNAA